LIYFLRCECAFILTRGGVSAWINEGYIKIGTSIRLINRLKQITAEIGHTPTVIAVCDGSRTEEKALHYRFRASRELGEWFSPNDELHETIAAEGRPWNWADESPTTPFMWTVRVTDEAFVTARIAAGYTGEEVSEYVSRIVHEEGFRDAVRMANSQ
jgi:hypothetical protein